MNKAELITKVSAGKGVEPEDVSEIFEAVIEVIKNELANGGEIDIYRFGKFGVKTRAAHEARNPRTGEKLAVPEKKAPYFKPSKGLRDIVNG